MSPHKTLTALLTSLLLPLPAHAITLTSDDTNYTTSSNITIDDIAISSTFSGTEISPRTITNLHIITTGTSTSDYGIKTTGDYNQITNSTDAQIITNGNSGRGISIGDLSEVHNLGSITTSGTTSYGIYTSGDSSTITNSGSITTNNSSSYGIYLNGDSNTATSSGTITTQVYGINVTGSNNTVTNSGTITTSNSSSAHGIFVSSSGGSSNNIVNNSGTINSRGNGIYAKDANSQIDNSGTITTYDSSSIYGIRSEGDNATITNSGNISATNYAIYNTGDNVTINNSGTLTGGVYIGNGTLNIFGGTISKEVDGVSNIGSVNIGSDSSSATFNQTASFTDLDSLTIKTNSTLNSYSNITANNIYLDENAILTIHDGSVISTPITGFSSSSGTLNISATSFTNSNSIGTSSNKLANLNINDDGSFTASSDIYVNEISVNNGNFNLNQTDNLTIFGNLTGSGSGTVNIGSTTQNINGDFTLTSGDTLAVTLVENTGNLTISGITNIESNSKLAITNNSQSYITNGSNFTIINAADGSTINTIKESNITVNGGSSNSGILRFTTSQTDNSLTLTISRLSALEATDNKNSQNIYQNINDIGASATGKLAQFQTYLDSSNLSGSSLTKAINQLAPQSTKSMLSNNINIINNAIKPIENHLDKSHQESADNFHNGIWIQTFGSSATQDEVQDDEGFKINSFGLVIAADQKTEGNNIIGAALNYSNSNIKSSDNLKTNAVDSYQLNFYHSSNFGKYFLDNLAAFTWNKYNSQRSITAVNTTAQANFNGQSYTAKIKAGFFEKITSNLLLTPELSLKFIKNNIDGYTENSADTLNLSVNKISANFLETRAGLNLTHISKIFALPEFKKIASNFKISYGHALINDTPTTISNFQNQSDKITSTISNIDNNSLNLETSITAYHIDNLTFSLNYTLTKKPTYQSHFASLKIRQEF
jgi:uncharacterized protein with beta-barrel porin domain